MSDIRTLHRAANLELADDGGIATLPENARSAHRHGKGWGGVEPLTERDPRAVRWVAVGLVVFWVVVILAVRAWA